MGGLVFSLAILVVVGIVVARAVARRVRAARLPDVVVVASLQDIPGLLRRDGVAMVLAQMTSPSLLLLLHLATGSASPPPASTAPPPASAIPVVASPSAAPSALASLPPAIVGTWDLDLARSDDPGPLLERLGVPWLFRLLAPKAVQQEIIVEPGRVQIRVSGQRKDELLTVDGKTPSRTELVGSPLVLVSRVEGDAIVSEGTVTIDGKPLAVKSVRQASAREMHVTNTFGTGPDAIVFHRVFVRVGGATSVNRPARP